MVVDDKVGRFDFDEDSFESLLTEPSGPETSTPKLNSTSKVGSANRAARRAAARAGTTSDDAGAATSVSNRVIKRRGGNRDLAIFIDGTALDRAARRINRKIDMAALLRGVSGGVTPRIARYYTIVPYEDDSRHRAFLDAVRAAGLEVIIKRLPPKGISRQVAVDLDMAVDIMAFGLGHTDFMPASSRPEQTLSAEAYALLSEQKVGNGEFFRPYAPKTTATNTSAKKASTTVDDAKIQKVATVVCPSRDLAYPIELLNKIGVDTVSVDFGQFNPGDVLKSAAKWIDLSNSETIWRP